MKWKLLALLLVFPQILLADSSSGIHAGPLNIRTINGAVSNYPYQLKITNGTLTDNGDGTMTLVISGGSTCLASGNQFCLYQSNGAYFTFDGTNLCVNVNSSQQQCWSHAATASNLLLEDGNYLLLEDSGKMTLE